MRFRAVFSALAAAAIGAAILSVPTAVHAATPPYYAKLTKLPVPTVAAMREANHHLFLSAGNSVLVLSDQTGALETTLTGLNGANGMTSSPDGSTLYVALSGPGQVAAIDTTSLTVTSTWSAGACVRSLALSGSVLFFSYGCDSGSGLLGALSVTDGSSLDTGVATTFYYAPLLAVAGSTLVVATPGITPSPVNRYDISGNTLTVGTDSLGLENVESVAASADGSSVASASGGDYQFVTYNPSNLAQTATFPADAYPTDVAFSHDGTLLAGGLDNTGGDELWVFNRATGSKVVSAAMPIYGSGYGLPVISGTLTFSEDDSRVFAVVWDYGTSTSYLATTLTKRPARTSVTLSVNSPKHFGAKATAVAHTGVSHAHVTLSVVSNGKTRIHHLTASAAGVVRYSWKPTYNGKVTVSFQGDLTHLGSQRSASYRAPSTIKVRMTTPAGRAGGVLRYHSASNVASGGAVRPYAYGRTISTWLMAYRGGRWVKVDTVSQSENTHGAVYVHLVSGRPNTLYKFHYLFKGDSFNPGSQKDSPRFTIG